MHVGQTKLKENETVFQKKKLLSQKEKTNERLFYRIKLSMGFNLAVYDRPCKWRLSVKLLIKSLIFSGAS